MKTACELLEQLDFSIDEYMVECFKEHVVKSAIEAKIAWKHGINKFSYRSIDLMSVEFYAEHGADEDELIAFINNAYDVEHVVNNFLY